MYNGPTDPCIGLMHIIGKFPLAGPLCAAGLLTVYLMNPGDSCNGQVFDEGKWGTYCATENPPVDVNQNATVESLIAD